MKMRIAGIAYITAKMMVVGFVRTLTLIAMGVTLNILRLATILKKDAPKKNSLKYP